MQNISLVISATDKEIIRNLFDNLEVKLKGIPTCNMSNYDKSNIVDEPEQEKIATKRETKPCTSLRT